MSSSTSYWRTFSLLALVSLSIAGSIIVAGLLSDFRGYIIGAAGAVAVLLVSAIAARLWPSVKPPSASAPTPIKPSDRDAIFEAIFNNTFQFTGLLSPNGRMIEANKTALEFAGITLDEVKGIPFWDTHWWSHDTSAKQRLEEAIKRAAKGEFVRYEDVVQDAKGNRITIDFSLRPVYNEEGQVSLLIPEGREIQEQLNIRQALEESERRFRTMVNSAQVGVTLLSPDGSVLYGNAFVRRLLGGLTQQDMQQLDVAEYTHPDDLPTSYEKLQALQRGEIDEYHLTKRFITRQKEVIWANLSVSAVRSDDGALRYILSLAQDITEQKNIEKKLQASEYKYRTLIEHSPFAYVIHQNGKIVFANNTALQMAAADTIDDLIGLPMMDFVTPEYQAIAEQRQRNMYETGEAAPIMEQQLVNLKGERFWAEVSPNLITFNGESAIQLVINDVSEKREAKEQLERSEFVLLSAERIAHIGSWDWDLQTNTQTWSEMMYEIYECDPKNGPLKNEDIISLIHPEDRDFVTAGVERIIQDQEALPVAEYRLLMPDGRTKYLEARNSFITNDKGQVQRAIGTVQDITARKEAALKLEESESQLKNLTDSIPGAVLKYKLSAEGQDTIEFISRGVIDIWGVTPEEALKDIQRLWSRILEEDIPQMRASIQQSAAQLDTWNHEWRVHHTDGSMKWLQGIGVPKKLNDGCILWDTIILDITQQKEAEERLRQSEQRYRSLFQNNLAGVYQIDLKDNKRVVSCNQAFVEILGYDSMDRVVGESVDDLFTSHTEGPFYEKLMEDGQVINWESKLELRNGRIVQTLENATLLPDHGNPRYMEGTLFDITKLKEVEAERIRLIEQLTFQDKRLFEFVYIVSHNLRSPVASLMGLTDLAGNRMDQPDLLAQVVDRMKKSAEELDAIIKDLNTILSSKKNLGHKREEVNLHKLLEGIVNLLKHELDLQSGTITIDLADVHTLYTVKAYLHNIFYNLIHNALKYRHPDRPPAIEITANSKGNRIQFEVKDNGMGIDLDRWGDKLFNLYQRFHTHIEGRGIGLYLVRSQVESLGGNIWVDSTIGEGTSFYLYFDKQSIQPEAKELSSLARSNT